VILARLPKLSPPKWCVGPTKPSSCSSRTVCIIRIIYLLPSASVTRTDCALVNSSPAGGREIALTWQAGGPKNVQWQRTCRIPRQETHMATMRILSPTAHKRDIIRPLTPLTPQIRRIGLLHNGKTDFDRLAAALPAALKAVLPSITMALHRKERYSSGAPEALLRMLCDTYDVVLTGLAA